MSLQTILSSFSKQVEREILDSPSFYSLRAWKDRFALDQVLEDKSQLKIGSY